MIDYSALAKENFENGLNCAQAVLLAFSDKTGLDENTALALSSSFGGGMGRLREVCGAVSGMFMVAGILYGYTKPEDHTEKTEHYKRIQYLAQKFKDETGSIICRELLGLDIKGADDPVPQKRTESYYKKRPCAELVALAAGIMAEYIKENPIG